MEMNRATAAAPPRRLWGRAAECVLWLAALWAVGLLFKSCVVDDTYIFLRFARNLAAGHGFRFNPAGAPVEGFTSNIWLFLLALADRLGSPPVLTARWLSLLCGALTATFLLPGASLFEGFGGRAWYRQLLLKLILILSPAMSFWSGAGMDTAIFVLASLWIGRLVTAPSCRAWSLGLAVGIASWVRLEALFVWLPWVILSRLLLEGGTSSIAPELQVKTGRLGRRWRDAGELLLGAGAMIVPQIIYRRAVFHEWLPNTYYAKVSLSLPHRLETGLQYFRESFPSLAGWIVIGVVVGAMAFRRRHRPTGVLLLGAVAWAAYVLVSGGDHFALGRFWLPLLPLVLLAADELDRRGLLIGPTWWAPAVLGAALVLCLGAFASDGAKAARGEERLTRAWAKVGRWLAQNERPGTRIATLVAGAIPYYSGLDTFDLLGLVTPEVAREGKVAPQARPGHQHYNTDALLRYRPDLIVLQSSGIWTKSLVHNPELIDQRYAYALYDAYTDPRIQRLYQPTATRLPDGTWLDALQLRE
jgi:arabinofuranosyltransferase